MLFMTNANKYGLKADAQCKPLQLALLFPTMHPKLFYQLHVQIIIFFLLVIA